MNNKQNFNQTYWNNNMNDNKMSVFNSWVGDYNSESKVFFYNYLKKLNYKNIIDMGCGNGTLYDGIKNYNIDIEYTGVDSCDYFLHIVSKKTKVIKSDITNVNIDNSSFDIVFGRHVVEHQPEFESLFNEMIRIAKYEVVHIFFIKPTDKKENIIKYDRNTNLFHNDYSLKKIYSFLNNHIKVLNYSIIDINNNENALIIKLK